MENAFNPLGVYLNFWHPELKTGERRDYTVAMVNDEYRPRAGKLRLEFVAADAKTAASQEIEFSLEPLGAQSYVISLTAPSGAGSYNLQAIAVPADDPSHPTISHRDVTLKLAAAQ